MKLVGELLVLNILCWLIGVFFIFQKKVAAAKRPAGGVSIEIIMIVRLILDLFQGGALFETVRKYSKIQDHMNCIIN